MLKTSLVKLKEVQSQTDSPQLVTLKEINDQLDLTIDKLSNNHQFLPHHRILLKSLQVAIFTESLFSPEDKVEALKQVYVIANAWNNELNSFEQNQFLLAINYLKGMIVEFPSAQHFTESCHQLFSEINK